MECGRARGFGYKVEQACWRLRLPFVRPGVYKPLAPNLKEGPLETLSALAVTALKLRLDRGLIAVNGYVQGGHIVIIVLALPEVAVFEVPMVADVIGVALLHLCYAGLHDCSSFLSAALTPLH